MAPLEGFVSGGWMNGGVIGAPLHVRAVDVRSGKVRAASVQSRRFGRRVAAPAPLRMVSTVSTVEADAFEEQVLKSDVPVLVDFYAEWCGPCKLMAPLMDWAASNYGDKLKVVKVDTEKHQKFVKEYKIHGLPTLAVFVSGENVAQVEGAMSKAAITNLLESSVPAIKA